MIGGRAGGPSLAGRSTRETSRADEAHRVGVGTPVVVVLFAIFAVYAALFALVSHGAEAVWGEWAAGGYLSLIHI